MGLADDIINGNYTSSSIKKKKKEEDSLADQIIFGTYKSQSLSENKNKDQKDDEEKENTFFKKSNLFDDGYQFGDISGTVISTIGDVGINVAKGIAGLGEGLGDAVSYGIADIYDWTGNDAKANAIRERTQEDTVGKILSPSENFLDKYSVLGEKSDSISEGLGYVAGITAVSVVSGGIGGALGVSSATAATIGSAATTFTSAMGNGISEALKDGATKDEARIYGAISGAGESLSELMFGGLGKASQAMGLSKGALDDVLVGGLTKNIKNKMVKTVVQSGLKATGEGLEEVVSGLISAAGKKLTYMDEKEMKEIVNDENLSEQFWMGALTSAIAQTPSTIRNVRAGTDYITGRTENEQKVYDNEVNERKEAKIRETTIQQAYNEQIKTRENLGVEITENLKAEIMKKVENAYDNGTLKSTELNKKDLLEIENQVESDMEEGNISAENIMKILGENKDLSKDNLLMKSMYENEQKYNSYQVEKTDNEKVNVLMQSAADAGMNNANKTRKKVELISKLVQDTDRQYKFVSPEQLKEMGYNEKANGLIDKSTGEILINAHSEKGLQSIVGHETTHIFDSKDTKGEYSKEYQTLQEAAIEYAKAKGIYDGKIQSITEAYGDLLVDESQVKEELTADLVGDFLFNDEKFIENLAVKDRNVFQKIYDYIKHVYKVAKAGTKEEKALENLKYQFDKVYKTISAESNTDTKYSIAGKEGMKNAIKNDTGYLKLERDYNKAQQMQKAGIDNENIRQETGWFQDKNGDWKFEFSDKDMALKENIKLEKNKTYKLSDILEHDTLFTVYPDLKNYKITFSELQKANGSYNINDKGIRINNNKLNTKNYKINIEGTLIHEIQHAIQSIEGFEGGKSSKGSKLAYYESLGEIEAADTKTRFIQEKYENKDLTDIAPESSKVNPKHQKLDNYLKNRNLLDKAKDSVYNYIKKRIGDSNENIEEDMAKDKKRNNLLVDGRRRYINEDDLLETTTKSINNIKYSMQESEDNSGSFSMQDNKGRTLSKEQQEYFKDSKIRDEEGNLVTVYHGTNNAGFTEFNRNINYFTDNKNVANTYTGKDGVYEGYVNITNPIIIDANEETWSKIDINNILIDGVDGVKEFLDAYGASTWKENGAIRTSTADLVSAIYDAIDEGTIKADGIVIKNIYDEGGYSDSVGNQLGTDYIVFNSNQFKNSDNKNPTLNADIRYSLSENKKDNKGRLLSKEQQEYFKDSKVRDENGSLLEVYHGTPYEFYQFNYDKLGENTSSLGPGFYFTDKIETAEEYKRNGGNLKEVYLDLKKPLKYGETTITKSEYKTFINAINEETNGTYLEDYDGIENALMEYDYGGDDIDLVNAVHNASGLTYEKTFEILRNTIGYDGIISDKGFLNPDETLYVVFNANQIKNVDNTNPSFNNDMRLSMTKDNYITGDDIAVKDMLKQEKPTIKDKVGKESIELPVNTISGATKEPQTVEDVITQTDEQKQQGMKDKAQKYLSRSKTKFINKIVDDFGTSKIANTKTLNSVVDLIREDIQQNGSLTKEKADSYFNELYNNLVTIDTLYYDSYKNVKDEIRSTKLYISDAIKENITDYNNFRKNNMGTLIMTNDNSSVSVDTYYKELSEMYPELFPNDILNPADQLNKISEVAKDITKVEMNVAAYNDKYLGKDYKNWARAEFDKDISDFTQDIKLADRYNNATNENQKIGVDKDIIKQVYKQMPDAKKTYEKVMSKELLTKEDKVQVERLLNNEISPQEIPKGLNKKGIIKVAEAKLEYDTLQKTIKEYQDNIRNKRIEEAKNDVGNLDLWKDKNIGFKYSRETPIRNIYDVAPKEVADNIANKYFRSYIETNEKKVIDTINGYNDRIRQLDIGTKNKYDITYQEVLPGETKQTTVTNKVSESALVQLLGENKITVDDIIDSGADATKIENAVKEFRNIYNELIEQINESMLDNGYAPVEYRKDYFPHFTEEKADTLLGKAAKLLGIDITNREELPTDIAGQTYQFKPGRTWFSNILQRTTDVTDYDALKGFDKYVRGATDLIYHTGDIQNLRALSTAIRGTYNDTEIKNKIEEIKESTMSDLEKSIAIQEIYEKAKDKSHLSKFVEWLDNYTNLLAGKKAINDRGSEKELNRQMYKTMQDVESRIAANAIGGNIGVSLTNFAPISQAWGEIKTTNLINGIWQTMKATLGKDTSFSSESQFITRRKGADTLSETALEKVTKPLNNVLQFADDFTTEVIVRSRYNQNLQEGMNNEMALEEADRYTAGLMADRGRGALPTQFSNKNPVAKMINMFQVEVNNQWGYYLKDLPKNIQEKANNNKAKVIANTAIAYSKIMVGAYLTNELLGSIRGKSTRVLPDPIYIISELIKGLTDDDDENDDDAVIETLTEVAGNLPFISLPASLVVESFGLDVGDIGRIPISGAIPNVADITSDMFDMINGEKTLGEGIKSIGEELIDTVGASLALPYGGSQIKKTVKGLSMYLNDVPGSYTDSGDLRYTVDDNIGSKVQSAVFGAYANPYAQDYIESGYKTISKDNIEEMVGLDMNSTEYRQYKKGLSNVSKTKDKNGYSQYTDKFNNVYWYDEDTETMYDNSYNKTTLTKEDLTKTTKTEESLNYINSLDLTDKQKTLAANNLNKNSKKTIDMSQYGNYSSYDEYKYARDYPEKYSVVSQITDYDSFVKYKNDISDIKEKYSTEAGYESKERKAAVQSYINGLNLNTYQKMMLEKMAGGYSIKNYKNYIQEYLETTDLTNSEKYSIWEELFN